MNDALIFGLLWFGALGVIWLFILGATRLDSDRRKRCIQRLPERRTINHDYRRIKP